MKSTKNQAIAAAKRGGYILSIDGGYVTLDAPAGMTFDGDSHYKDYIYDRHNGWLWGDIWDYVVSDSSETITPCRIKDCDTCKDNVPAWLYQLRNEAI